MVLEFAALVRLRISQPNLARPYRIPFGLGGTIAISLPPVGLCLVSIPLPITLGNISASARSRWECSSTTGNQRRARRSRSRPRLPLGRGNPSYLQLREISSGAP
jgi:hypothetical protein